MIFLVVFAHSLGQISAVPVNSSWLKFVYYVIFSFHMPVFIFISGWFSAPGNTDKAISKYLIPYILANTVYGLSGSLLNRNFLIENLNPFSPHWTFWYLLSLFFWKVLHESVSTLKYPILFTLILALAAGAFKDVGYFLSLSRTIAFFPYYLAGYYMHKNKGMLYRKYRLKKPVCIFVVYPAWVTARR